MSSNAFESSEWEPSSDLRVINERLAEFRVRLVNVIGPGGKSIIKLETLPESYEVQWHGFRIDPSTEKGAPHLYHDSRWAAGECALKRELLVEFWAAANGQYVHSQRDDDGKDPLYARYTWAGSVLSLSGTPIVHSSTKEMDLREGSDQLAGMTSAQKSQQRANISQICESKAQNRVIRSLLGISSKYTAEQVQRPFVLMKLIFVPNMKDPLTRFLITANSIGAANALFGGPMGTELMRQLLTPKLDISDDDVKEPLKGLQAGEPQKRLETSEPKTSGQAGEAQNANTVVDDGEDPFRIEKPVVEQTAQKALQILTMEDYENLEKGTDPKTGKASAALVAALDDLLARNPNKRTLTITKPMSSFAAQWRRKFVEQML